ncbi:MAG: hypothetical protein BWY02_02601 [bacterium ADurb.Bin157]|nr:MAG: hypothetical protein BWY02_02601 [bacterium ADurb.Bin157]
MENQNEQEEQKEEELKAKLENPYFQHIENYGEETLTPSLSELPERVPYYLDSIPKTGYLYLLYRLTRYLLGTKKEKMGISYNYIMSFNDGYEQYTGQKLNKHKISYMTTKLKNMGLIQKQRITTGNNATKNVFTLGINNPYHIDNRKNIKIEKPWCSN